METIQINPEPVHHVQHNSHNKEVKSFYIFVGIIFFCVVFLQPLAMLTVIFAQAMMQ